jgi:hypothetical protein
VTSQIRDSKIFINPLLRQVFCLCERLSPAALETLGGKNVNFVSFRDPELSYMIYLAGGLDTSVSTDKRKWQYHLTKPCPVGTHQGQILGGQRHRLPSIDKDGAGVGA